MDQKNSEISANFIYSILLPEKVFRLKRLLKDILEDYDNPFCDYILRQCKNKMDFERFLKDYPHLFIVESDKVARYSETLEIGQETADKYFEDKLHQYNRPMGIKELRKCVENAPDDIRNFIKTFCPDETEFKNYLQKRTHLYYVSDENIVCLTEKACAEFFRKNVKDKEGVLFMSLRGNVAQAPQHIRKYISNKYPGTEFRHFLENNCDVFQLDSKGGVSLIK